MTDGRDDDPDHGHYESQDHCDGIDTDTVELSLLL